MRGAMMCLLVACVVSVAAQLDDLGRRLYFNDANIPKSIPNDWNIANPSTVGRIQVTNINVDKIEANAFENFTSLKVLDLSGKINGIEDGAFRGLSRTEKIILKANIQNIGPNVFSNLNNLKWLHMNVNKIKEIRLNNLAMLEDLSLSHNEITKLNRNNFIELQELVYIAINNNKIRSIKSGTFSGCPNLRELFLYDNQLVDIEPDAFRDLQKLEVLFLSYNYLKTITPNHFKGLTSLKKLHLSFNKITSLDPLLLNNLTELTEIWFDNNKLKSFPLCIPGNLTDLELAHNELHGIALDKFCGSATQGKLLRVDLSSNNFTSYNLTQSNNSLLDVQPELIYIELSNNFLNADIAKFIRDFQLRDNLLIQIEPQRKLEVEVNDIMSGNNELNQNDVETKHGNETTENRNEKQNTTWIVVTSAALAVAVFAVIAAMLLYKQRRRTNPNPNVNDAVMLNELYDDVGPASADDDDRSSPDYDYPRFPPLYDDVGVQPTYLAVLPDSTGPQPLEQEYIEPEENHYEEIG